MNSTSKSEELSLLKEQVRNNSINKTKEKLVETKTEENSLTVGSDNNSKTSESVSDNGDKTHPRSGNFNDTDVSIEKFFYSGNK